MHTGNLDQAETSFLSYYKNLLELCHWHEQEVLMETLDLFRILVSNKKCPVLGEDTIVDGFHQIGCEFISNHRITHGQGGHPPSVSSLDLLFRMENHFFYSVEFKFTIGCNYQQRTFKKQFNNTTVVISWCMYCPSIEVLRKHLSCIMFHWFSILFKTKVFWKFCQLSTCNRDVSEVNGNISVLQGCVLYQIYTWNDAHHSTCIKRGIELIKFMYKHTLGGLFNQGG